MEESSSFSAMAPHVFNGENFQMWAVRIEVYLEALDLWKAIEEYYEVFPLPENPKMFQLKNNMDKKTSKSKAKACLFSAVSSTIFTRIMSLKSKKAISDYLKAEYEGDDRIKGMQVLNLIRDFKLQKMRESKTIKEYSNRLMSIANIVRLLGSEYKDSRIVEKILVNVPERFEATITTLENTKDLSKITLAELLKRVENTKKKTIRRTSQPMRSSRSLHQQKQSSKRNQLGHEAIICKNKLQQQDADAQVVNEQEEDQLFVASCFPSNVSTEPWLIDNECTNYMTVTTQA
ncbi:uncharacterized protein LOC125861558 [Solanum stenotomum]|uniref:uncharacterized protein LOC125861558 n=1 Tax=Solanum stenotomum TaxID=172797 RepID=UPI0020D0E37C|nr:uncharacterized protein LOC125861558 [Solanum stenotomum]